MLFKGLYSYKSTSNTSSKHTTNANNTPAKNEKFSSKRSRDHTPELKLPKYQPNLSVIINQDWIDSYRMYIYTFNKLIIRDTHVM